MQTQTDLPFGNDPGLSDSPAGSEDPQLAAEVAAVRLLSTREHTRAELTRKLASRGHDADVITAVLDDLAERGLQSDARYVEQYIDLRTRKGYGPARIRAELAEKGVPSELVQDWLDPRDPQWWQQIQTVVRARFGAEPPADRKDMARRARFLEYRGFSQDHIRRVLLDG